MRTDYITSGAELPPNIPYPRFLLTVDRHGRVYAALSVDDIAGMIDRTPATVRKALNELEGVKLVERIPTSYKMPDRIYVKLPNSEGMK